MLKSISKREFGSLLRVLQDYLCHIETNPDSLMVKFFGAYKLRWKSPEDTKYYCMKKQTTSYIIVMDNIFVNFDVGLRFDLKGSTRNRTRLLETETPKGDGRDLGTSLKCEDFRKHFGDLKFKEQMKPDMPLLEIVLDRDTTFLSRNNLMDYSLLLGEIT